MDSQSNALYDNPGFLKLGLGELSFNATANGQDKPKTPKSGGLSQTTSPSGRKFFIVPAGSSEAKKALESSTSPFLSPSTSFVKSRQHHSMKSLKLGERKNQKLQRSRSELLDIFQAILRSAFLVPIWWWHRSTHISLDLVLTSSVTVDRLGCSPTRHLSGHWHPSEWVRLMEKKWW